MIQGCFYCSKTYWARIKRQYCSIRCAIDARRKQHNDNKKVMAVRKNYNDDEPKYCWADCCGGENERHGGAANRVASNSDY
jgi:hypothetical protein